MVPDALHVGALLRDVGRLHVQVQRETVAACGSTTLTQCLILTEVGRQEGGTLAALSRALGLDKSWTSRAVDTLVAEGLLTKEADTRDRRTIRISLSAAGTARLAALTTQLNRQAAGVLRHIPHEEWACVERALILLAAALRQEAQVSHALREVPDRTERDRLYG